MLSVRASASAQSSPPICVQGWAKRRSPGLVNFVTALAYHFCPALPPVFTQPGDYLLADPCIDRSDGRRKLRQFFVPDIVGGGGNTSPSLFP